MYRYTYMYILVVVKGMKGCEALRHRFPFCGIESLLNSSTLSLSTYLRDTLRHIDTHYTLSLSLSLSLSVLSLCRLSSLSFSFAPLLSLCCSLQ